MICDIQGSAVRTPQKPPCKGLFCDQDSFTQEFQVQKQQCPHLQTSLVEAFVTFYEHTIISPLLSDFHEKQVSEIHHWLEAPLPR